MASNTDIANLALLHLGFGKTIQNLDTERTAEANACRIFYDTALDIILCNFDWPFAGKKAALGLVETFTNPETDEWKYSYQYPSDSLNFRKIYTPYVRNTNMQTRIPYRIFNATESAGKLIFTDQEDAIGEYTVRMTSVDLFPADFKMAFSYLLAAYIAPSITNGDNPGLANNMLQMAQFFGTQATARNANEEKEEEIPQSEFIQARNGDFGLDFFDQRWR